LGELVTALADAKGVTGEPAAMLSPQEATAIRKNRNPVCFIA
jgi:hypothetical protein